MSFMFNPHPYDDYTPVNRPAISDEIKGRTTFGAEKVMKALSGAISKQKAEKGSCIVAIEGYPSADFEQFANGVTCLLKDEKVTLLPTTDLCLPADVLEEKLSYNLPTDRVKDPVLLYGRLFHGKFADLMDAEKVAAALARCTKAKQNGEIVILYGMGAASEQLLPTVDLVIYLDVTPKEVMLRAHAGRWKNFGDTVARPVKETQRRAYYVDFELAVTLRGKLLQEHRIDYYVASDKDATMNVISGADLQEVTASLAKYPFRCKPVYLEGVWGGYYIQHARKLPNEFRNIAWIFDLIPMEVSILIDFDGKLMEMPFFTFVQSQGDAILGKEIKERFGGYFPIRFNYDDTFHSNGNMSIQVHPPREYCMENFDELGTQDEGYYIVATGHGAKTYCGLREGVDKDKFFEKIKQSEKEHTEIDYKQYVNGVDSVPGRQFLIPGGTIHASGRNQLILEIGSLTMGSYTFKLYDYLRKDLDGNPRPIHSYYGEQVLKGERTEKFVYEHLVKEPILLRTGDGFEEYIVGEDPLVYYSTRQLRFEKKAEDDTTGKFHVLALVDGEKVIVRSKKDPDLCYTMNFLDLVVVPADMGEYEIVNLSNQPVVVYKVLVR